MLFAVAAAGLGLGGSARAAGGGSADRIWSDRLPVPPGGGGQGWGLATGGSPRDRTPLASMDSFAELRAWVWPDGWYAVSGPPPRPRAGPTAPARWVFAGYLGAPAEGVKLRRGTDALGAYREVRFKWRLASAGRFSGSIRLYDAERIAVFAETAAAAQPRWTTVFPRFTTLPSRLHLFSYREAPFAPYAFDAEDNGTPWLFFDDGGRAAILSPAAHFLTAAMEGDGVTEAGCGLDPDARNLPAGFTTRTLLAFGSGINRAWDTWGRALRRMAGRVSPPNDADPVLRYLGYWTDNGAYYYYRYDPALGYAGTLRALVAHFRTAAVPVRYLQLDSWWYRKSLTGPDGRTGTTKNPQFPDGEWNRYGGLLVYRADPAVFPRGLAGFQQSVNLPLIVHNRWIDPASPYRQKYRISGYAAVDPGFWDEIMGYLTRSGAQGYEQDWLSAIYEHSPELRSTPGVGARFTGAMADAAAVRHLSLQYCMALPRFFLQGARYGNLTTIRVSDDRFSRDRWDSFLYGSRLAGSLGLWPWSDVFMSTERDNLLLATLSGGGVGFGDRMGAESRANLLRSARPDGVLVRPDAPIFPTDETYLADARGDPAPMVAWTRSANPRTAYVFAYGRGAGEAETSSFTPAEMGLSGGVVVLDVRAGRAWRQPAGQPVLVHVGPASGPAMAGTVRLSGTGYYEIAEAGPEGLAFFGDAGKFVSNGAGRIAAFRRVPGGIRFAVLFALNEAPVELFGYSRRQPTATASEGAVGRVQWDPRSGKFVVYVAPGSRAYWGSPSPNSQPDQTRMAQVQISAGAAPTAPAGSPRP
ncbi:MAG: hypothetical protein ACREFX_02575 [Opitutaceae bacterium]